MTSTPPVPPIPPEENSKPTENFWLLHPLFVQIIIPLIGILVGLATSILTYNYETSKDNKSLLINLRTQSPIVNDAISNGLEFTVNGIKTNNIYLNEVEIINVGRIPILESDFYKNIPIKIDFGSKCKILNLSKTNVSPKEFNSRSKFTFSGGSISFLPTLINPGDRMILKTITADCKPAFLTSSNIVGVPKILETWTIDGKVKVKWLYLIALIVIGASVFKLSTFISYIPGIHQGVANLAKAFIFVIISLVVLNYAGFNPEVVKQVPEICKDFINR